MLRTALPLIVFTVAGYAAVHPAQAVAADQSSILDAALAQTDAPEPEPAAAGQGFQTSNYPVTQVNAGGRFDGGHVGGFLAYTRNGVYDSLGPVDGIETFEGWMAGVNAGYDFKLNNEMVAGFVGDLAWANVTAVDTLDADIGKLNWAGSIRGRLGIDGDYLLPYVTAGLAVAGAEFASSDGSETVSGTHMGWTVGVGIETSVSEQLSIDLLYRYSDYGTVDYAYTSPDVETITRGLTAHQISLGLNYAF